MAGAIDWLAMSLICKGYLISGDLAMGMACGRETDVIMGFGVGSCTLVGSGKCKLVSRNSLQSPSCSERWKGCRRQRDLMNQMQFPKYQCPSRMRLWGSSVPDIGITVPCRCQEVSMSGNGAKGFGQCRMLSCIL